MHCLSCTQLRCRAGPGNSVAVGRSPPRLKQLPLETLLHIGGHILRTVNGLTAPCPEQVTVERSQGQRRPVAAPPTGLPRREEQAPKLLVAPRDHVLAVRSRGCQRSVPSRPPRNQSSSHRYITLIRVEIARAPGRGFAPRSCDQKSGHCCAWKVNRAMTQPPLLLALCETLARAMASLSRANGCRRGQMPSRGPARFVVHAGPARGSSRQALSGRSRA